MYIVLFSKSKEKLINEQHLIFLISNKDTALPIFSHNECKKKYFYHIQGVPKHWAHFLFVIFSGSGARTEELLTFNQQPWKFAT